MRFVVGILVLLFALLSVQSSTATQTVARAHAIASAGAFDPASVDLASSDDAPARPRKAPIAAAVVDPADDRGAERPVEEPREKRLALARERVVFARLDEASPRQRSLGPDVPPPR